jgi:hypothetical protein
MMLLSRALSSAPILLAAVVGLIGCNDSPKTVDDVIARNTEAMGGQRAIEAVQRLPWIYILWIPVSRWMEATAPLDPGECALM